MRVFYMAYQWNWLKIFKRHTTSETTDFEPIIEFLKHNQLFNQLKPEALKKLAEQTTYVYLQGGEILFRQHDKSDAMYIVLSGRLRAFIDIGHHKERPVGEVGY